MLYTRSIIAAAVLITLSGCNKPTLDYRNAEISNGMIYENNENTPFTGLVTNFPESSLPPNLTRVNFLRKALGGMTPQEQRANAYNVICDSNVKNGYLTGETNCYTLNSRLKRFTLNYSGGQLDGNAAAYAANGSTYLYKGGFKADKPHGRQEFYKLSTGELLERFFAINGTYDGLHERWDPTTGTLIYRAEADNGTYIGTTYEWRNDGLMLGETPWEDGKVHGTVRVWDKETGNLSAEVAYVNGIRLGSQKRWASDGRLISEGTMGPDGLFTPTSTTGYTESHSPSPDCVDLWIDAFRAEAGEEAMINNEQLGEWESWCENGQRP